MSDPNMPEDLKQNFKNVLVESYAALQEALALHGLQHTLSATEQYVITAEEFGEIAKALVEKNIKEGRMEIRQTIAMLVKLDWILKLKNDKVTVKPIKQADYDELLKKNELDEKTIYYVK